MSRPRAQTTFAEDPTANAIGVKRLSLGRQPSLTCRRAHSRAWPSSRMPSSAISTATMPTRNPSCGPRPPRPFLKRNGEISTGSKGSKPGTKRQSWSTGSFPKSHCVARGRLQIRLHRIAPDANSAARILPLALVAIQIAFTAALPRERENSLASETGELLRRHSSKPLQVTAVFLPREGRLKVYARRCATPRIAPVSRLAYPDVDFFLVGLFFVKGGCV